MGGAAQTDSLAVKIDSTVVSSTRRTSLLLESGHAIQLDVTSMGRLPSLLGTADPVRFVQMLPGVASGSEYDAGVHIQGCENGHNMVSMSGVPVYGATHILGLFSAFNPAHFPTMQFSTQASGARRLGGSIRLDPEFVMPDKVHGSVSLGLFSSQGNLRLPTGKKSALSLSARRSFINLLYGSFLRIDEDPFRYGFDDGNLSWVWQPSSTDRIWADAYFGSDKVDYSSPRTHLDVDIFWWNALGAVHHRHDDGTVSLEQALYFTTLNQHIDISHDYMEGMIPSYIRTYGYKADIKWKHWSAALDLSWHQALPQQVCVDRGYGAVAEAQKEQQALEGSIRGGYERTLGPWTLSCSSEGMYYLTPERESRWFLAPEAGIGLNLYQYGKLDLRIGAARQHLFLTGITNLGFPVEFWFLAGRLSEPQTALFGNLSYRLDFAQDRFSLTAEVYGRRLWNQIEYDGTLLDVISSSYRLEDMLLNGDGWNYGLTLLLHKKSGRLTGWLGYSLGRSLRRTESYGVFPSSHERIHELNLTAEWSERRWDAGGSFVAASGTPFTAPESAYLAGGQILCLYGPHNGARLRPYIRLDVNFNWYFRHDEKVTHGVNFSMYNVLGRRNEISYRIVIGEGPSFAYLPFCFALQFMPSAGWFIRF